MDYCFTWHDIHDIFEQNRSEWPESWRDVAVYSDSVEIYQRAEIPQQEDFAYLKQLLGRNYVQDQGRILIDFSQKYLDVVFEEDDDVKLEKHYAPLFRDIYYQKKAKQTGEKLPELPGSRIIAFHSYKGGVGRTLSLTAFLRQCSEQYPEKKILVLDADVEAPGLTWTAGGGYRRISYLDILSVMNYETMTDAIVQKLAELTRTSTISVLTDKVEVEQYFLPVYREKSQTYNISATPEKVLLTQENKFYITENISKIGAALGAELVLVDLRAGITDHSAPFLFDPRVEKYFVSSTSMQSVRGTNQILDEIYQKVNADHLNSKILLTMIPTTMKRDKIQEIEDQIVDQIEFEADSEYATFLRESYFLEVGFDQNLIHIDDLSSLFEVLKLSDSLTNLMDKQIKELFAKEQKAAVNFTDKETRHILKKIFEIARDETTAEGSTSTNMLVTSSIKEMAKNFKDEIPRIVVSGAKGSGKTYIYKQLLQAKTWGNFIELAGTKTDEKETTVIVPLLSSLNNEKLQKSLLECAAFANEQLGDIEILPNAHTANYNQLLKVLETADLTRTEWIEQWKTAILRTVENECQEISDLDKLLQKKKKRIVYIVDGLEDLCQDSMAVKNDRWKFAIKALCQNVVNDLRNLDYGNIGIVVFARRDMLNTAIDTNTEQFRSLYQNYELNWTQTEALRLALWLAAKACPALTEGIDVLTATKSVLIEKLTILWGVKLGRPESKEAFSDRWILAALSDFTGQLQARDIVRFLRYSTESYQETKLIYKDRLIMPVDVRNAIKPCAEKKLGEIASEMKNIYEILEKFEKMEGPKTLPLTLDKLSLTGDEISRLEAQGYLKISDKKYYLPEIIRLALGFTYERGARPKVLSLLVQQ